MKRNRRKEQPLRVVKLWSFSQADKARPYLRTLTSAIREDWLSLQSTKRTVHMLEKKPGRPDRQALLARETAITERDKAEDRFSQDLDELNRMDVFLIDPVHGTALIPFAKDDNLAWFVYDLFEDEGLTSWRLHEDPIEMRRPIDETIKLAPMKNTAEV